MTLVRNKSLTAAATRQHRPRGQHAGTAQPGRHKRPRLGTPHLTQRPTASQSRTAGCLRRPPADGTRADALDASAGPVPHQGEESYYRSLGVQAVVSMDPLTHTVRDFGKLNGYLTGPLVGPGAHHGAALRGGPTSRPSAFTGATSRPCRLRQDYVDPSASTTSRGPSRRRDAPCSATASIVRVTRDGRVLAVQGSPVSGLAQLAAKAPPAPGASPPPRRAPLSASNVDGTSRATRGSSAPRTGPPRRPCGRNHDYAKRVWFVTRTGLRPGWSTYVQTSTGCLPARHRRGDRAHALTATPQRRRQRRRAGLRQLPRRPQGRQGQVSSTSSSGAG